MKKTLTLAFALVAAVFAGQTNDAHAGVITDSSVHHSSQVVSTGVGLASSLGTTHSTFSGASAAGWSGMVGGLASSDVLFLGQYARTDLMSGASLTAIGNFVAGGGTYIQLWGEATGFPAPLSPLFNSVTGESVVGDYTGIPASISQTANAAGTTFAGLAGALTGASDHGGITLASVGSGISMYETGTHSHVTVYEVGLGKAVFVSWDFCCSASTATRGEWEDVLVAAATYESAEIPEPASIAIFGVSALGLVAGGIRRRKRQQAAC